MVLPGTFLSNSVPGRKLWPWEWRDMPATGLFGLRLGETYLVLANCRYGRSSIGLRRLLLLTQSGYIGWILENDDPEAVIGL